MGESEEIRIWIAACATGEEAYSLAMLLFEQLSARGHFSAECEDPGNGCPHRVVGRASSGAYGEYGIKHLRETTPPNGFSGRKADGFQISQDLRQLIVFGSAQHHERCAVRQECV